VRTTLRIPVHPLASTGDAPDIPVGTVLTNTNVVAASVRTARQLLGTADAFVDSQSQFDRQARLNVERSVLDVTPEVYLDFVAAQVMEWAGGEVSALKQIVADIDGMFNRWPGVVLPSTVYLVKTSGREEGYAAYTRAENVISLPANMIASLQTAPDYGDPLHPSESVAYLEDVIVHELFHLISKNNPGLRASLYALVNYSSTPSPVVLPDVPWPDPGSARSMPTMKITNPDAPALDVYITMVVPEDPENPGSPLVDRCLLPVLMATGPYVLGQFFDYLAWYFMAISTDDSGNWVPLTGAGGRPVMYLMTPNDPALWNQYLDLVGHNLTGELFHPDELIAQNFVFVATLPSLGLLTSIGAQLAEPPDR
jgi:hypothetical protein